MPAALTALATALVVEVCPEDAELQRSLLAHLLALYDAGGTGVMSQHQVLQRLCETRGLWNLIGEKVTARLRRSAGERSPDLNGMLVRTARVGADGTIRVAVAPIASVLPDLQSRVQDALKRPEAV